MPLNGLQSGPHHIYVNKFASMLTPSSDSFLKIASTYGSLWEPIVSDSGGQDNNSKQLRKDKSYEFKQRSNESLPNYAKTKHLKPVCKKN